MAYETVPGSVFRAFGGLINAAWSILNFVAEIIVMQTPFLVKRRFRCTSMDVVLELCLSRSLLFDKFAQFVECLLWLTTSVHTVLLNISGSEQVEWYHATKAPANATELILRNFDFFVATKDAYKRNGSGDLIIKAEIDLCVHTTRAIQSLI
jgi:hypothetical protein